ncbi:helix-turn-helix domain-containing protein [Enterococcus rivorum]|uniref:HTH cro/C1-type domain-containing protein n=1 Tax=Enterococcus rivorum TaxID=762845 RepID=A0A1E5KXJ7_9ENTE|nr:helix-turn-helix transcriptional regulator [Enterococcus rivorum]MBP2099915.1 transcriptional regulator with XRE-family HTH domain [Enterococcus rivorum]OEH82553.1 hypothetical protein BCR26_12935 [Enterococcus rivorum]
MEIDLRTAGQRIKKIRMQHNYTMLQFAKMLGFSSPSTVNNWEKGNNLPIDSRLDKIAILGNTTVDWIKYGSFKEYVQKLLTETYSASEIIPLSPSFLNQLLDTLEKRQLSYHDDLQILIVAKKIYPELFATNELLNEHIVVEEYTSYNIEKNKFYRETVLPKIEKLFSESEKQSLNISILLRIFDLLESTLINDRTSLKFIHDLTDCFIFLITLKDPSYSLIDDKDDESIAPQYVHSTEAKRDYLKSKNHLISLLDLFHVQYHFTQD